MTGSGSAAFAAAGVLLGVTAFVWLYVTGFLRRGRRQANAVDATITEADVSHDLLPDGGAAVRRRYVVEVVNQGDRPVHDVVIECFVGRAAAKKGGFRQPADVPRLAHPRGRRGGRALEPGIHAAQ